MTVQGRRAGERAAAPWRDADFARTWAVRRKFGVAGAPGLKHHHDYPLTSVTDHLDAFSAAGINDVEVPWRAFCTCLFMGRTNS